MCRRRDGSLGNGVLRVWRGAMGRWGNRSPAGAATAAETGVATGHRNAREGEPEHPEGSGFYGLRETRLAKTRWRAG